MTTYKSILSGELVKERLVNYMKADNSSYDYAEGIGYCDALLDIIKEEQTVKRISHAKLTLELLAILAMN